MEGSNKMTAVEINNEFNSFLVLAKSNDFDEYSNLHLLSKLSNQLKEFIKENSLQDLRGILIDLLIIIAAIAGVLTSKAGLDLINGMLNEIEKWRLKSFGSTY